MYKKIENKINSDLRDRVSDNNKMNERLDAHRYMYRGVIL